MFFLLAFQQYLVFHVRANGEEAVKINSPDCILAAPSKPLGENPMGSQDWRRLVLEGFHFQLLLLCDITIRKGRKCCGRIPGAGPVL